MNRKRKTHSIKAIPTSFNGVEYKSRLEARFAEFLYISGVDFMYETPFPSGSQRYVPDFYLPFFRLYIEVKPKEFIQELDIFTKDIRASRSAWICVDSSLRGQWNILLMNQSFLGSASSDVRVFTKTIEFTGNCLRLNTEYLELSPWPHRPPPAPEAKQSELSPTEMQGARSHFARMMELLGRK